MGKTILIILFLMVLYSCDQQKNKEGGFQINAEITGVKDGVVKLLKLDLSTNEPIIVDSSVVKNEKFTFTGKVDNAYLHTIKLPKSSEKIHLFLENSDIFIKGDIKNLENVKISGSREDSLFRHYTLDDIFERKKGKEIILKYPDYNYAAMVSYYQFQYFNLPLDTMQMMMNGFSDPVKKSDYYKHLNNLYQSIKNVSLGQPAPDFSMKNYKEELFRLNDFKGKYVLIDFWASWCAPCRKANPVLVNVYNTYKNRNFTIVGVSVDKDKKRWLNAIAMDKLPWENVSNLKGWDEISTLYGVKAVPQNFLLDPGGIIIDKNIEIDVLMDKLDKILQ